MYQKTAIDMRLAKISAKIYELENQCFKMTEETNKLLNEVSELVSVRYKEAKIQEKKSHNLYSDYKDIEKIPVGKYHTIFDPVGTTVDLTQATAITLEAIQKAKKEQSEITKKTKGNKK